MDYFFRIAVTQATQEALKYTVLSSKTPRYVCDFVSNAIYFVVYYMYVYVHVVVLKLTFCMFSFLH